MIVVTPPATPPFIPSTQTIASIALLVQVNVLASGVRLALAVNPLDPKGQTVAVDRSQVPPLTAAQVAAVLATVGNGTDTLEQAVQRAALPYLEQVWGLTGLSVK